MDNGYCYRKLFSAIVLQAVSDYSNSKKQIVILKKALSKLENSEEYREICVEAKRVPKTSQKRVAKFLESIDEEKRPIVKNYIYQNAELAAMIALYKDCKAFFYSDWGEELSGIEGEHIEAAILAREKNENSVRLYNGSKGYKEIV